MVSSASRGPLSDASGVALSTRAGWVVAVVATLVMAVSYVDRQAFAALSPTVTQELGIGPRAYGWLTAAFSVAYLAGAPLAGWLVDRIGPRRGLVVAVLAWSAVSAGHALAGSFAALFFLRIALGAAESPSFPGAARSVRAALPPRHRSAGFGLLFTGSSLGAMVAAPLAIGIAARSSWRFAFFGTAAAGLLWVPAWVVISGNRRVRAALAVPEAERPRDSLGSLLSLAFEAPVARGLVLILASAPSINFVLNWLPKYLVGERGLTQNALGSYLAVPALFLDVGAIGFGVAASLTSNRASGSGSSAGVRPELIVGAGVLGACLALAPFAQGPWGVVACASACMAGGGGLFALLTADMLARVATPRVSSAAGLCAAAQSLAYIVGNLASGDALEAGVTYGAVIGLLGAIVVPGVVAWIAWGVAD